MVLVIKKEENFLAHEIVISNTKRYLFGYRRKSIIHEKQNKKQIELELKTTRGNRDTSSMATVTER